MGLKLSKSKVASQCSTMIQALETEKGKLKGIKESVDDFVKDPTLKAKSWETLKQQMEDYAHVSDALASANRSMIADCHSLSEAAQMVDDDPLKESKLESTINGLENSTS